jgi:hypothetical protein
MDIGGKELYDRLTAEVPLGSDAEAFVERFDRVLDEVIREASERYTSPPWKDTEKQLAVSASQAWAEIRSVATFAEHEIKLGLTHPELKTAIARQQYEEMTHYNIFQECFAKMGVPDILEQIPPEQNIMDFFQMCDNISPDPVEAVFACQFCTERGVLFYLGAVSEKPELHPVLKEGLVRINADEGFHVSIGRTAARILYKRGGEKARKRMFELAAQIVPIGLAGVQGACERAAS